MKERLNDEKCAENSNHPFTILSMAGVPLSPLSSNFGEVEQLLQLQLNAPHLVVDKCYDLTNPHLNAQFATFCKSTNPSNVVSVFIPTSKLDQSVATIAAKGLTIDPVTGFHFSVGSLNVNQSVESLEVVRLMVALGNTLNHQLALTGKCDFLELTPTSASLMPGYHSLCVTATGQYAIFNPAQVKCCNLVQFAGGSNLAPHNSTDDKCDMCGDQLAVVWCVNDSAKLCESCDEQSHKHNHIHRKHQRIPLSDARAMMETCPDHPDVRVDYYCPLCQAPVCVNCKMTGHHSKGEAATHTLVSIGDVYRQAILATEKDDPIVVQRDDLIQQKFNEADRLLQEILENEQKVEAEIQKKAQAAIRQARQLAGEKALIVRSVQTELQRKQEEMKALTRSIQIHKTGSRPLAFLRASDRHALLVSSLQGPADLPASLTVRGDLEVRGDLSIEQSDQPQIPLELELPEEPLSPISQNLKSEPGCDIPSLSLIAQRRERRNQELGIELTVQPFRGSKIITDQNVAKTLYLSLPFKVQPLTHLLFSSSRDGRSVRKMHEMIDGIGITAIIVRHGDFTFGGFAASKWNSNGKPFGDASGSFLFSLSQDAFISHRPETENPCVLCATEDTIAFGQCDLVISDDLDHCSSELENNYGVGWPHGSTEAQTFLAGQKSFAADEVEVWGFFTIEAE